MTPNEFIQAFELLAKEIKNGVTFKTSYLVIKEKDWQRLKKQFLEELT